MTCRYPCLTRRPFKESESGAVAIMVALMSVLLLSVAAIGVDLGNAMNRKQLTRNSADFAALAGANGLPATTTETVQIVADYLNSNETPTDGTNSCNPDAGDPVTTDMLTDGDTSNGEVTFPSGTTRIRVVSPASRVDFGLAAVMGFNGTCVQSEATARIASGNLGMAPYYATSGCDQGPQVLKSDAGGPSIPFTVPTLANDSDTNTSTLNSTDPNPSPNSIPVAASPGPDGPKITLTGTNLGSTNIDSVGFFNSDQSAPKTAVPDPATQTDTSLQVLVPNAVAGYQDVWWVRVHNKTTGKWSQRSTARPLLVGEVTLSCKPDSASGNFGSIDLPWGGNDLADLESNIKSGLRPPTSLVPWSGPLPGDNTCNTNSDGVISTDALSKENTNCVQSVTGLKAGPAYDGMLKNPGGKLLSDTSTTCQSAGRPPRGNYNENSDVLSCFLRDDVTGSTGLPLKLSDTVAYNGSKGPLFTQDIWKSPRFLLVPTIDHDPSGTKWMPITGVVAGFITDQPTGASKQYPLVTGSTDNGLVIENPKKLRAIRVFFFDIDALPDPPDGIPLQDYFGSGPKLIDLVN